MAELGRRYSFLIEGPVEGSVGQERKRIKDGRRNNYTFDMAVVLVLERSFEPENLFLT